MNQEKLAEAMRLEKGVRHAEMFLAQLREKAKAHMFRSYSFDEITDLPCKVVARLYHEEHVQVENYRDSLQKKLDEL